MPTIAVTTDQARVEQISRGLLNADELSANPYIDPAMRQHFKLLVKATLQTDDKIHDFLGSVLEYDAARGIDNLYNRIDSLEAANKEKLANAIIPAAQLDAVLRGLNSSNPSERDFAIQTLTDKVKESLAPDTGDMRERSIRLEERGKIFTVLADDKITDGLEPELQDIDQDLNSVGDVYAELENLLSTYNRNPLHSNDFLSTDRSILQWALRNSSPDLMPKDDADQNVFNRNQRERELHRLLVAREIQYLENKQKGMKNDLNVTERSLRSARVYADTTHDSHHAGELEQDLVTVNGQLDSAKKELNSI